jgi:hypothetical protein
MQTCGFCGTESPTFELFCGKCGWLLGDVTKDVTEITKPSRPDMLADSMPQFDNERQVGENEAVLPDVALPFP